MSHVLLLEICMAPSCCGDDGGVFLLLSPCPSSSSEIRTDTAAPQPIASWAAAVEMGAGVNFRNWSRYRVLERGNAGALSSSLELLLVLGGFGEEVGFRLLHAVSSRLLQTRAGSVSLAAIHVRENKLVA